MVQRDLSIGDTFHLFVNIYCVLMFAFSISTAVV